LHTLQDFALTGLVLHGMLENSDLLKEKERKGSLQYCSGVWLQACSWPDHKVWAYADPMPPTEAIPFCHCGVISVACCCWGFEVGNWMLWFCLWIFPFLTQPYLRLSNGRHVSWECGVTVGAANLCCAGGCDKLLVVWRGSSSCPPGFMEALAPFVPCRPQRHFVS